ncbi:DUF3943 domain-containing protein [candidate division KSB1 bacterium]|nr:DUF3943 domain-containing protein [candidate division KSB1 bacterium]
MDDELHRPSFVGGKYLCFLQKPRILGQGQFSGTLLQSTLFEYTVEAWEKPPSGVDLVVTPIIGSFIGSHVGMRSFIFSSTFVLTKYIFRIF